MKKFKSIACLILAMLTFMTMFVATASAAELPASATLHITKYEVTDSTGNIQMDTIIGNTDTLTGTTADAGNCHIGAYTINEKTYISVVVGCETNADRYNLTLKLISELEELL